MAHRGSWIARPELPSAALSTVGLLSVVPCSGASGAFVWSIGGSHSYLSPEWADCELHKAPQGRPTGGRGLCGNASLEGVPRDRSAGVRPVRHVERPGSLPNPVGDVPHRPLATYGPAARRRRRCRAALGTRARFQPARTHRAEAAGGSRGRICFGGRPFPDRLSGSQHGGKHEVVSAMRAGHRVVSSIHFDRTATGTFGLNGGETANRQVSGAWRRGIARHTIDMIHLDRPVPERLGRPFRHSRC